MKLPSVFHPAEEVVSAERDQEPSLGPLAIGFALLAAGLLVYSQTIAFHWDEGFHILTARLIDTGKRPYLDFFFPQTPVNAYWNAAWMAVFGARWRVVHVVAALVTVGSVLLIAQYLFALVPDRRWRPAAAFAALALFGLHSLVWEFGAVSQAYPLCLLLVVAAFRSSIAAVARPRLRTSALAGFAAGATAGSSLLTAAVGPVLLVWIWLYNRSGNRWTKAAAFVAGAALACAPLLILFVQGPYQVIFNILKYHSIYRRVNWEGATSHDVGIATDWLNSSPSLLLVLLALAGLVFIRQSEFNSAQRAELRLCLWLPLAISAQNLFAHPTFPQYFVFIIPFLTVLAGVGFYAVAVRLQNPDRPRTAVILLLSAAALCLGNSVYEDRDSYTWHKVERVANKMKEVTPKGAPLLAPEQIYFLTNWPIPPGMEHADAHKLKLAPAEAAKLHVVSKAEVERRVKAGEFPTTVSCDDDDTSDLEDWDVYSQKAEFDRCVVFWQFKTNHAKPKS
jgi:4-amino-4-deoxy-L-arabinose transferase-like glycosyltransferase